MMGRVTGSWKAVDRHKPWRSLAFRYSHFSSISNQHQVVGCEMVAVKDLQLAYESLTTCCANRHSPPEISSKISFPTVLIELISSAYAVDIVPTTIKDFQSLHSSIHANVITWLMPTPFYPDTSKPQGYN